MQDSKNEVSDIWHSFKTKMLPVDYPTLQCHTSYSILMEGSVREITLLMHNLGLSLIIQWHNVDPSRWNELTNCQIYDGKPSQFFVFGVMEGNTGLVWYSTHVCLSTNVSCFGYTMNFSVAKMNSNCQNFNGNFGHFLCQIIDVCTVEYPKFTEVSTILHNSSDELLSSNVSNSSLQ